MAVILLKSEDSFQSETIIYQGINPILGTNGLRVYPDVYDVYITGQHSPFSDLTRVVVDTSEIIDIDVDLPEANSRLLYMAHIDDGFIRSAIVVEGANTPNDMFHSPYPELGDWTVVEGLDRRTIDTINVDMPQSPRFLVGLPDNIDEKVLVVLVGFLTDFDFSVRYPTVWSGGLNPNASVTDLESVRII